MILKIFLECLVAHLAYSLSQSPILIVVSYDAFRYDFFDTKSVPHMNRLRKLGTYSDYLINVFPTKTFPNHHSIATGLYPDIHGVVGNSYFNKSTNSVVHINYEMFHFDEKVVPIWRQNEDAGKGRHSGVVMWPGGCYPYQGKQVTYCKDYDHNFDWFKRVDLVIGWIKDPKKPANLIMLYFDEPDTDGHIYGINSDVVNKLINKLDNITLYLQQQLEKNNLTGKVTVVHLSDHGMLDVKPPNFINVTQYLTPGTYTYAGSTPVLQFHPKKGFETEVYQKLKNASSQDHFTVYKKEEFLPRWHYKDNPRSPPILVLAEVGYGLDDLIISAKQNAEKNHYKLTNQSTFGVHGYDYTVKEMRPFFMARGPKIKVNHKVPPFNTVDLFNFFCAILEIAPTKNNGSLANVEDIFVGTSGYSLTTILTITEKTSH
ncbi:ectonucleotide pyrophosphatase/phosphodiesterase family member 5 isoform X2 [Tribolium castaneum]|uniref:ectonucleotide pyrophosphatase/phosphodiesterase family member 5 isoform X2 n=1 Tax=Tribolium castaneum TaxID=7070 RepID=UPI00077DA4A7|nr:PREDICTED: ectonucleotide pyrophosphatase/phosphodiesterase family member 5 isoform X2 [Tribolium castaneum]|eukprot:XP_015833868.1 PREDICTED: ectonucleotide pyrophosphatase/phosphodiesterase family member 5 isoform X2 [Tribolium castaneum]